MWSARPSWWTGATGCSDPDPKYCFAAETPPGATRAEVPHGVVTITATCRDLDRQDWADTLIPLTLKKA